MYAPAIDSATPLHRYDLGEYEAVLLGKIKSRGAIEYLFILAVFRQGVPCLFVTSEVNGMSLGNGSHFLCVFQDDTHVNMGASDEWSILERFESKALELAGKHLHINDINNNLHEL